jgi:hypothetical protein
MVQQAGASGTGVAGAGISLWPFTNSTEEEGIEGALRHGAATTRDGDWIDAEGNIFDRLGNKIRDKDGRWFHYEEKPSQGPEGLVPLELPKPVQAVSASAEDCATAVNGRLRDPKTGRFISDPANPPSPYGFTDAQRRAAWKQLVEDPNSGLSAAERGQIKARGNRGPQRINEKGELETMELSHEPVPLRDGGKKVVPRWPSDHAAIDPHRRLKK